MSEVSEGKDNTIGHWAIAGIFTQQKFPIYPKEFPKGVLETFLNATGCSKYLGTKPVPGKKIITKLGDEHVRTAFPVVNISSGSMSQTVARQDVIPLEYFYKICEIARKQVTINQRRVGRACHFIGQSKKYIRTPVCL
jgi:phosphopentomutase